jgi:hypothetical protein
MKLLLATLISLFSLVSTNANATDEINVSSAVVSSFKSSFKNASEVAWKMSGHLYKADFSLNGQYVAAYYDATANLIAVTRNISSFQLPVTLQNKLKASYESYWISDLFELSDDNGTAYYVTVEDGDSKITLKSTGANEWSVFQKQRKS